MSMLLALAIAQAIPLSDGVALLSGNCSYPGGALARGEVQIACDSALISSARDDGILVQFVDRSDGASGIRGFAGRVDGNGDVQVERVYLTVGHATPAAGGHCRLFMSGETVTGVSCVGRTTKAIYVANFTAASK